MPSLILRYLTYPIIASIFLIQTACNGSTGEVPNPPPPDIIAPKIELISPTPGSKLNPINSKIEIVFDENIKQADTSNVLIRLYDNNGSVNYPNSAVDLSASEFLFDNKTLSVNLGTLQDNARYQVIVKDFIDISNNKTLTQCQWDFATGSYSGTIEPLSSKNCGKGLNTPDVTAPTILAVTPTGLVVPNTSVITIIFSEAIDETTLNSNITISKMVNDLPEPLGTYDYNYNAINNKLTLIPNISPSLELNSRYQIEIGTGILDTSGNALEAEHITFFRTFADISDDVTPPLASITPIENATINPSSDLIIQFNEGMTETTILANIKLSHVTTGDVLTSVNLANIYNYTYDVTRNEVVFSVIQGQSLAFNSKYRIEVLTGITDRNGNLLAIVKSSTFSTIEQPDVIPPEILVSSFFPVNGSSVEPTINIVIPFSERMKETTLQSNIFLSIVNGTLTTPATTLVDNYSYAYDDSTKTVTFTQLQALTFATSYRITVKGGTGGVQDKSGNELASDFISDFATNPTPDKINPTVLKVIPANGTTISVNKDIVITFSEPMKPQTFTGNFKLYELVQGTQSAEIAFPYTINVNPARTVVTLKTATTSPALLPAKDYRLVITGLASGVLDTAGNEMIADTVTDFKTAIASHQWTWVGGEETNIVSSVFGGLTPYPGNRRDAVIWKDPSGMIWLFGGGALSSTQNKSVFLNDLWEYTPSLNRWIEVSGNRTDDSTGNYVSVPNTSLAKIFPSARDGSVTWFDTTGNLWLFGGVGIDSIGGNGNLNDLWKYELRSNQWTWVSGSEFAGSQGKYSTTPGIANSSNQPPARGDASSWIDSSGNLWMYGGSMFTAVGERAFNDLWKYIPQDNMWIWVSGSQLLSQVGVITATSTTQVNPGARTSSNYWADNEGNFWLLGGYAASIDPLINLNGLWKFNPTTEKWLFVRGSTTNSYAGSYGNKLTPSPSNLPGSRSDAVTWVDSKNNFWLYGGSGMGATTTGQLNDLWKFDGTSWTWMYGSDTANQAPIFSTIGTSSTTTNPGSRTSALGWIDSADNLWLFGGYTIGNYNRNDLWKYTP